MSARRAMAIFGTVFLAYVVQTSLVAPLNLPLAGPDVLLLVLLAWFMHLPRPDAVGVAFVAGLFTDIAPPVDGPVGRWALILIVIALAISPLATSWQADSPLAAIGIVALASSATIALGYLVTSVLGESHWLGSQLLFIAVGVGIWNLVLAPGVMLFVRRLVRGTTMRELIR